MLCFRLLVWIPCILGLAQDALLAGEVTPVAPPRVLLTWPTENRALLDGRPADFFQTTISGRLISGMYGFVRSNLPEPPPFFERFHEGIDIQPVRRDAKGRPLDQVYASAPGKVAYANTVASRSNFGLYVILEHTYGPYKGYTTYGHLASISVRTGQAVAAGDPIGILGHTGNVDGLSRAHLHFEFGFMFHGEFASWFDRYGEASEGKNLHGRFNGNNLFGVDPQRLLLETSRGHAPTVEEIFAREKVLFRVRVPAGKRLTYWQQEFPFLTPDFPGQPWPNSWEVDCNRIGMPLRFRPSPVKASAPELIWFDESLRLQDSFSRGLVEKKDGRRQLSKHGIKWATLLVWKND